MDAPGPSFPPSPRARRRRFRRVLLALTFLTLVLAAALIRADKPWEGRIGERIRAGERLSFAQSIHIGLYGAGVADLALLLILLATARLWLREPDAPDLATGSRPIRLPGWVGPSLIAACVIGGGLRLPLANGSLWWDEIWNLRRAVMGERTPSPGDPAQLDFHGHDWGRTFFHYSKPTNHLSFSVASRLSLGVWRVLTGAKPWEFNEFWFRLPNFLAALASIWAIGRLLAEWRHPRAGVAAAFLLALHPWHIRYGVEGRAFSFLLLLSLLSCLVLTRALRTGRWRAWIGFGLLQAGLLWTFPYAIYLCATLGVSAIAGNFARFGWGRTARVMSGRCLVGCTIGAMVLLPLVGPLVPQVLAWTDVEGNEMIHASFLRGLWAGLATGMPWAIPLEPGRAGLPSLSDMARGFPPTAGFVLGLMPLLLLAGLVRALQRDRTTRAVVLGLVLATPLTIGIAWAAGHYFYARYVIYGLAAVVILCVLGIEQISDWLQRAVPRLGTRPVAAIGHAGFVLLFALLTHPQRLVLLTRPIAPQREVAAFLAARAAEKPILAAGFNLGGDTPGVYYPWVTRFETPGELAELARRAGAEGRELVVFFGYNTFNRTDAPEAFAWIDEPAYFESLRTFAGIESQFHYTLLRHTGRLIDPASPPRNGRR